MMNQRRRNESDESGTATHYPNDEKYWNREKPGWPPENPPPVVGSKSPSPPSGVQPDNSSQAGLVFSAAFAALALYGRI
jgi:hypothetical protein